MDNRRAIFWIIGLAGLAVAALIAAAALDGMDQAKSVSPAHYDVPAYPPVAASQPAPSPRSETQPALALAPTSRPATARAPTATRPTDNSAPALDTAADAVHVDDRGVISVHKQVTLRLRGTTGKNFTITGDIYPTGQGGGFTFYLRQVDSYHRYELTIGGMRVKRSPLAGKMVEQFAFPMKFAPIAPDAWHHFSIAVAPDRITAAFDDEQWTALGPLETDGTNHLVLNPGVLVKNVKIQIVD